MSSLTAERLPLTRLAAAEPWCVAVTEALLLARNRPTAAQRRRS